jgi:hypothetical protein
MALSLDCQVVGQRRASLGNLGVLGGENQGLTHGRP